MVILAVFMNIYRCSYLGAGRVYVIVAAVHILFDRYHFNMLKNPVQLTDIIERQVNQLELLVLRGGSVQVLDEEALALHPDCNDILVAVVHERMNRPQMCIRA